MVARSSTKRAVRAHSADEQPGFVGREALFAAVATAFERGARIVTLLGPPGIGKSRAARQFAGTALAPPLVLDDASSETVRRLLDDDPAARLLVTSRTRLGLPSEITCEVPPLGCPADDASDDVILASEAVRLFILRAEAAGADPNVAPRVLGAVARRLEGLPLALEIAAARTRATPAEELLGRPDDPTGGALATAFAWSADRLDPADRRALAALSVFAGPFTSTAAEAILGPNAADRILSLRDHSLLASPQRGTFSLYAAVREHARSALLDPDEARACRQRHVTWYASRAAPFNTSRMFTGSEPQAHLRGELSLQQANVVAALGYARELGDTHAAATLSVAITLLQAAPTEVCEAALTSVLPTLPANESLARATVLLARQSLLHAEGRFAESDADVATVLALPALPAVLRAETHVRLGVGQWYRTDYEAALASHELAERVLADEPAPRLRAMSLACVGRLRHELGDLKGARRDDEASRELCRELGDRWLEGLPLANLAQLEQEAQRFSLARDYLDQAFALFRETAERHYERIYHGVLGDLCFERGSIDEARAAYDHAVRTLSGPQRPFRTLSLALSARGALEAQHGERAAAEASFREARAALRRIEASRVRTAITLHEQHLALRIARDLEDATALAEAEEGARARLAALVDGTGEALLSIDVRFARRILERALRPAAMSTASAPRPMLEIGHEASFFRVESAPPVSLLRRGPLRRLLATLVDGQLHAPGTPLSADRLIAAAWPDERLIPSAASTRLRVGIATLRTLGLRRALLTSDDGYLLDPAWVVVPRQA